MKLFVNDLTVMDFSYLCPERGMVGESWIVDIVLDGGLNDESMVQDFGLVKKHLKRVIDDYLDHKLVVPIESSSTFIDPSNESDRARVDFSFKTGSIHLCCPSEAYAFVYAQTIDMASVTSYLKDVIAVHLPSNVHDVEIALRPEQIDSAFYHYTHGLKKHDGNCQRIAHGHRSKIIITENGEPNTSLQNAWAERWQDIYIGTQEDLVACKELSFTHSAITDAEYYCFKYAASQGQFEMAISRKVCEIISSDTTVECLAQFVFDNLKQAGHTQLMVRAFEGVGKGAIVSD